MQLVTAGVNSPNLVFRAPTVTFTSNNLQAGCVITVGPSPLWRTGPRAQVQAYEDAHLSVESCP